MTALDALRTSDDPGITPELDPERLARMAEATCWMQACPPPRRRRRHGQRIACALALIGGTAAVAWLASDIAVAVLLDEARLIAWGITP